MIGFATRGALRGIKAHYMHNLSLYYQVVFLLLSVYSSIWGYKQLLRSLFALCALMWNQSMLVEGHVFLQHPIYENI